MDNSIRSIANSYPIPAGQGLTFVEFLRIARRVREVEISTYREVFKEHQTADGEVDKFGLKQIIRDLGYMALPRMIEDFFNEVDEDGNGVLDFSEFFNLMINFRDGDGFTGRELEELTGIFNIYASAPRTNDGELTVIELNDVCVHFGYVLTLDEVRMLVKQVDYNKNNKLDFREFVQLMSLHREAHRRHVRKNFDDFTSKDESDNEFDENPPPPSIELEPLDDLTEALEALDYSLDPKQLKDLLEEFEKEDNLVFEDYLEIVDHLDRAAALQLRQKAAFSDSILEVMRSLFNHYDKDRGGTLEALEIVSLFRDLAMKLETQGDQAMLVAKVAEARSLAAMSGVPEEALSPEGACVITFPMLCHLIRMIQREFQRAAIAEDKVAMEETGFTELEANEFRQVFNYWAIQAVASEEPDENKTELSETAAILKVVVAPHGSESEDTRITLQGLRQVMKTMGANLQRPENEMLKNKISKFKTSVFLGTQHGQSIRFPDFLRLMRWMITENFADINKLADKTVSEGADVSREADDTRQDSKLPA